MSVETGTEPADTGFFEEADFRRLGLGAIGTAAFLGIWWVAALFQPLYLLPSPVEVGGAFATELTTLTPLAIDVTLFTLAGKTVSVGANLELPRMVVKLLQSLFHYIPGLVVGSVLGISLGVAMGWSGVLDDAFTPVTRVLRPIPPLAWIAFSITWIGINHAGAAFIIGIGAFWINFYNAYSGVEGVPTHLQEVAASLGVDDTLTMVKKVVLPSAAPSIMTGIRTSIGQCWMIVVAAELFGAPGIGFTIINAGQNAQMHVSVAYMMVISAVFLVSDGAFRNVEGRVLEWRD